MRIPKEVVMNIQNIHKPCLVGVSGFGGSGKSTTARELGRLLDIPVVSVDSFMRDRTLVGYHLWEVMDFDRLASEVIQPFRSGERTISYGHFDWDMNSIHHIETLVHDGVLIIEGVGLFRPGVVDAFDCTIWIDCPREEATRRVKLRDREENQNPLDEFWDGIWKENDQEYLDTYSPKEKAEFIIENV